MNRKLYRKEEGKMIGGVCAGLGDYLVLDPVFIRLIFVLLALGSGFGVIVYLVLWVVMPSDNWAGSERENLQQGDLDERIRTVGQEIGEAARKPHPQTYRYIGLGLILFGAVMLVRQFNIPWLSWLNEELFWPLALILIGGLLVFRAVKGD